MASKFLSLWERNAALPKEDQSSLRNSPFCNCVLCSGHFELIKECDRDYKYLPPVWLMVYLCWIGMCLISNWEPTIWFYWFACQKSNCSLCPYKGKLGTWKASQTLSLLWHHYLAQAAESLSAGFGRNSVYWLCETLTSTSRPALPSPLFAGASHVSVTHKPTLGKQKQPDFLTPLTQINGLQRVLMDEISYCMSFFIVWGFFLI